MSISSAQPSTLENISPSRALSLNGIKTFVAGLILPFSFAPFRLPGLAILSLSLLYGILTAVPRNAFRMGFIYGLGFFGFGVSWVLISINQYGHLNYFLSATITLAFVVYLALFTGLFAYAFKRLKTPHLFFNVLLFSSLWILVEYFRATFLTGFPWTLVGHGQVDSPIKDILPIFGVYGASFLAACSSALIAEALFSTGSRQKLLIIASVTCILSPKLLGLISWTTPAAKPLSVGVVQANLSMRDKWDENLFWNILTQYQKATTSLLGKDLIILPESAIPLPAHYVKDFLDDLALMTQQNHSTLLFGIPEVVKGSEGKFYNTLTSLDLKKGVYRKQHLVPFGEYIPAAFRPIVKQLGIPDALLQEGQKNKTIFVKNHPIAALICYELAYGDILKKQLPKSQMIISISDDGWFGHSLAIYQHLQMAQAMSLQAKRDQILANNDGLSALIDQNGDIIDHLPAFKAGILKTQITPRVGATPWVIWGDWPILIFASICFILAVWIKIQNRKD